MAVCFLRLGVRECPRMLLLERLGLQVTTFATKATGPKKNKKVKGAGPQDVSRGASLVQATDMTAREQANLLSKKTLLHFPGKSPGQPQTPLAKELVSRGLGAPEHSEQPTAACHSRAVEVPVGEKTVAGEESDSSSDSSSDSDEETVTGDAFKSPVTFLRHDSVHRSPAGNAEWTKERKQVEQRAWASKPQAKPGIPVSSSSSRESPIQVSKVGEEQEAPVAPIEATGQRIQTEAPANTMNQEGITACTPGAQSEEPEARLPAHHGHRVKHQEDTTACSPGAQSEAPEARLPAHQGHRVKHQEGTTACSPGAQSEAPEEHQLEEEVTADPGTSSLANAADTSLEPVKEPVDEVLDPSTYKNTQHHDYTPLTFVDLDMEMAKYRLPQPSSGRLTPWH